MSNLQEILGTLEGKSGKIVMFADGFVDEVWEIVAARADAKNYTLYTDMNQLAERITNSGSGGVGMELVQKRRAFGGFTANIGYAAASLGADCSMVGVFGDGKLDSVFEEVAGRCEVISVGAPAVTHVFEFDNGKIMMSNMEAVLNINWQNIVDAVGLDRIKSYLQEADIVGVGYWSVLPNFDEILDEICKIMPNDGKKRRFFFDFADFNRKDKASLVNTLAKLKKLNEKFPMILSVNEHEAEILFADCGETLDDVGRPVQEKAESVRQKIGLDELVVHTLTDAFAAAEGQEPAFEPTVYCEKPLRTAGAGDTFNGGYVRSTLAGLSLSDRLKVANVAVGYFIRNAAFPEIGNLK